MRWGTRAVAWQGIGRNLRRLRGSNYACRARAGQKTFWIAWRVVDDLKAWVQGAGAAKLVYRGEEGMAAAVIVERMMRIGQVPSENRRTRGWERLSAVWAIGPVVVNRA